MDAIHIRDLALWCIIGTNADERTRKQQVVINIEVACDLLTPCASDRIEDTIDYRAMKRRIVARVEDSSFHLLEKLAQAVAEICLSEERADAVTVAVDKPGALTKARSVAVEISRRAG